MFSFDKLVKKNAIHSAEKNTSAHPVQSALMPSAGHKSPYAIQEVPCFNQTMVPATNIPLRLQKVSVQRWNITKQQAIQSQKPAEIQQIASTGVQGTGQRLPHLDRIQKAFGHHNISSVKAYLGTQAVNANRLIGARAYATGSKVAFADSRPDLHTTAHEAAHIIQQRTGVQLKGGVGEAGDRYEQLADNVADNVVRGKSAESLLDSHAGPSSNNTGLNTQQLQSQTAVQRAVGYEFETGWLVEVEETTTSSYFNPKFYYSKFKSRPLNRFKKRRSLEKAEKIVTFPNEFKIEADEAGKGKSEIEFIVHPPVPENDQGLEDLIKVMNKITDCGTKLEEKAKEAAQKEKNGKEEEAEGGSSNKEAVEFSIQGNNNKKFYVTIPAIERQDNGLKLIGKPQATVGLDLALIKKLHTINQNLKPKDQAPEAFNKTLQDLNKPIKVPENTSPELKGLLTIIVNYLKEGAYKPFGDDPKWRWDNAINYRKMIAKQVMARTQFSKLYKLLPKEEQDKYKSKPTEWIDLVMEAAGGLDPDKSVIERGIRQDELGENEAVDIPQLTKREWLIGITRGVDKLRAKWNPDSLGALKDKTDKVGPGLDKNVGIFEFREIQGYMLPVRNWFDFAINFFKFIRAAHAGKGKTKTTPKRRSKTGRGHKTLDFNE